MRKTEYKVTIKRLRKTGNACYFMGSFACGFETQGFALQTVSPQRQISPHEITQAFPMFCLSFFNCILFQVTEYDYEK